MSARLRFVLFDLDGTLIDTSPLHDRGYRETLAAHRPDLLDEFRYEHITGLTTDDAFVRLGVHDASERATLIAAKRAAFAEALAQRGVRAFPGAIHLLDDLARHDVRNFVVTSASRRGATHLLRSTALAPYVRGLVAAEDVTEGKPSPIPFTTALTRHALRRYEGFVLEDAPAGLAGARAAGLVAVRAHGRFDPREAEPWVANLGALHAALERTGWRVPAHEMRRV